MCRSRSRDPHPPAPARPPPSPGDTAGDRRAIRRLGLHPRLCRAVAFRLRLRPARGILRGTFPDSSPEAMMQPGPLYFFSQATRSGNEKLAFVATGIMIGVGALMLAKE